MKKLFFALLSILIIFLLIFFTLRYKYLFPKNSLQPAKEFPPEKKILPSSVKLSKNLINIDYGDSKLVFIYEEIAKNSNVLLIPNFSKKEFGQKIARDNSCDYAINGGFYKENSKPLGLFSIGGLSFGLYQESSIANGFFWQDINGGRQIGKTIPKNTESQAFVMQTGPFLATGNYKVKMITDEKARRSMLFTDVKGRLFMASIYNPNDNYSGPNLSDLPQLLSTSKIQEKISIKYLLNLDGGSASFFYQNNTNEEFYLSEITPVGSVICVINQKPGDRK
jgi:hypothetical protein